MRGMLQYSIVSGERLQEREREREREHARARTGAKEQAVKGGAAQAGGQ